MDYYTISFPPGIQNMTTIVTEFGKMKIQLSPYEHERLRRYIPIQGRKNTWWYLGIQNIHQLYTCLEQGLIENHIEQLRIIFGILRAAGLKFYARKCSLWLNYIPYLGYVMKWEGIKLYPVKVQGVMDLGKPTTTTESRVLIGMVQY